MQSTQADLVLDIQELKKIKETVQRPANLKLLDSHISTLETQLARKKKLRQQASKATVATQPKITTQGAITLTKYSYDQSGKFVKIYLSFQNASQQLQLNQIESTVQQNSIQVLIKGYKGSNHLFAIKKLYAPIVASTFKVTLKSNDILLTLQKAENKHWDGLNWKQNKFSQKEKDLDKQDPEAGIMNLMKKMYQDGDDNMKRTIAETWTKSRQKK